MQKQCIKCNSSETAKWYSGPSCRQCYRQQPHIKAKELSCSKISCAAYREKNKAQLYIKNKEWVERNKERNKEYQALYRLANRANKIAWEKNDRKNNIDRKLGDSLRNRLNMAIKNNQKAGSAVRDLGCSIVELKTYLEAKFQPGMTWENYGSKGWHIDHVKPLVCFDLTDSEEFGKACRYTNLQPLWAKDNLSKGAKLES